MNIIDVNPDSWGEKVNFVDTNNTLVGYDLSQNCCEHAGWYLSYDRRSDSDNEKTLDRKIVEPYVFDRDFFEEEGDGNKYHPAFENGGLVRFRLVADGLPDVYLHIFNSHNGYYGHGFTVEHSGAVVRESII
jgi:hypothetical protein